MLDGLLGVRERLDALRAIESGDADPRRFDVLADDWGVEERARAALGANGLPDLDLGRRVATLSGGETVATALTGISLSGADIAALDAYRGALIVSATTTPSSTV